MLSLKNIRCRLFGHDYHEVGRRTIVTADAAQAPVEFTVFVCLRCGVEQKHTVTWS